MQHRFLLKAVEKRGHAHQLFRIYLRAVDWIADGVGYAVVYAV